MQKIMTKIIPVIIGTLGNLEKWLQEQHQRSLSERRRTIGYPQSPKIEDPRLKMIMTIHRE